MLRSMYSGISGMKGFQTKLDVVGNNIANVNTTGFKKGRVNFQDMMSQTMQGAQGSTEQRGGLNPKQVGTGSQIGAIDTIHTDGFLQTTNRELDAMIEGNGMFVVETGSGDNIERFLTRVGNFYLVPTEDGGGEAYLVNSDGFKVLDTEGEPITLPDGASSFSIGTDGKITYVLDGKSEELDYAIALAVIPNPDGLEKVGGSLYRNTANTGFELEDDNGNIIAANLSDPDHGNAGQLVGGALEMSNVDLAEEFTEMITAQRGFQANTRIITTSDEILQELVNLKR